jgi:hydroxymethylbilane synthase
MRCPLILGSRGSKLALWQANYIKSSLERSQAVEVRIEIIRTTGDKIKDVPLGQVGGTKALFTKEIEEALLAKQVDLAVHSLKDMPTQLPDGLRFAAMPEREDPRDAFISRGGQRWDKLPAGARVGTSSLRRQLQLKRLRKDLAIEPLRGNLDTRLRKLDEGQYDAIVVAMAGLRRMGWGVTEAAAQAERSFLARLGGGCQVPIAAHAQVSGEQVKLVGVVVSLDGEQAVHGEETGSTEATEEIGKTLAERLLAQGADKILEEIEAAGAMPPGGA